MSFMRLLNNIKKNLLIYTGIISLACSSGACSNYNSDIKLTLEQRNDIAQCIADKGGKVYITNDCDHCLNQVLDFGSAFVKIPKEICIDREYECYKEFEVRHYPMWESDDGKRLKGHNHPAIVANFFNCEY